jgi:hypothetical protein
MLEELQTKLSFCYKKELLLPQKALLGDNQRGNAS